MLTRSTMALQRRIIEERLLSLLAVSESYTNQAQQRDQLVEPMLKQLAIDLKQMENGPLEQLRDRMIIRERILDTALQTAQMQCDRERIAVDLAEELGTLNL